MILIGTPCYGGWVHLEFTNSLIDLYREGIQFTLMGLGNESLISRGRNTIISYFYHNKDKFSHLLFLDADIKLPYGSLSKLLMHDKDVIGAAVPLKGFSENGSKIYNVWDIEDMEDNKTLNKVKQLGTAVMMLSTKAVVDLCDNSDRYDKSMLFTKGLDHNMICFDVFKNGVYDNQYLSEDYYVCKKLINMGYNIYIDNTIETKHFGVVSF